MALSNLLDEHVDRAIAIGLRRRVPGLVVWRVGDPDAPPRRAQDPELLTWCETHGFILVTNNRATMPIHLANHFAAGQHVPGIFMLDPDLSIGETIEELLDAAYASLEDEYRDQIRYLPLT
jgi:hypothetical protein